MSYRPTRASDLACATPPGRRRDATSVLEACRGANDGFCADWNKSGLVGRLLVVWTAVAVEGTSELKPVALSSMSIQPHHVQPHLSSIHILPHVIHMVPTQRPRLCLHLHLTSPRHRAPGRILHRPFFLREVSWRRTPFPQLPAFHSHRRSPQALCSCSTSSSNNSLWIVEISSERTALTQGYCAMTPVSDSAAAAARAPVLSPHYR